MTTDTPLTDPASESAARTIVADDADHLFCDGDGATTGPWTRITEQRGDARRWMQSAALILRHEDGTYWSLGYQLGLTEEQPHELPWRDGVDPVVLRRAYPHTVSRTVYRATPPAAETTEETPA